LPVYHAHGLFVAMNCVIASGASTIFLPRFDVDSVLSNLSRSTVLMGVPTHYTRLLSDERFGSAACETIRLFISGSAPLSAATHEQFSQRTGHVILERYGMTETLMLTSNPLNGPRKPGTVGMPLSNVDLRLGAMDAEGIGEIEVRGPNVFTGYWNRPELTHSEFTDDGYFRTGDLATLDDDGYITIVGRSKDLIISGGLNVYPKEVETVLDQIDGIEESAVVGIPHPDFGEMVVGVVVRQGKRQLDEQAIVKTARMSLAGFKVPKRIVFRQELPRNALGKVEKSVLRADLRVDPDFVASNSSER
jgi:malonyl-CoA/methylmalonyl-CoA synthetase